jgi:spore maturation protein CgeB
MVDAASQSGFDLAVYGQGWTSAYLDLKHLRGDWIPNELLAAWYTGAEIVLADHYAEMRELGFISNRIYDALACGVFVLSDDVPGLDEEFDGGAVGCTTTTDAIQAISRFMDDPVERHARAERGQRAVLARHTFERRADELIAAVASVAADVPTAIARQR